MPGMGQAYNGKLLKSAIIIGLEVSAYKAWKNNAEMYNDYHMDFPLKNIDILKKGISMPGGLVSYMYMR